MSDTFSVTRWAASPMELNLFGYAVFAGYVGGTSTGGEDELSNRFATEVSSDDPEERKPAVIRRQA
jgi:hypothetical protein